MKVMDDYLTIIAIYPDYAFLLDYKERLSNECVNKIIPLSFKENAFSDALSYIEQYKRDMEKGDYNKNDSALQLLYRLTEKKQSRMSPFIYRRFSALGNSIWSKITERRKKNLTSINKELTNQITRFIHLCLKIIYGALS